MADFFFFTDADLTGLLNPQPSTDSFGPISDTEFRVTSLHTATSDPRAFAICEGEIAVQEDADPNLVNLILKPKTQPTDNGLNFVKIAYYIYKGIKKTSLIVGGEIAPELTNHLTQRAYKAQNDANRKKEILENLPTNSVTLTPSLSLLGISTTPPSPTQLLEKLFYKPANSLFQNLDIKAGNYIGDFDKTKFGIEIVVDDIRTKGTHALVQNIETKMQSPPLTSSSSDIFKRKNQKETILAFMDPCAFYGSLFQYGSTPFRVKYRISTDVIDIATPSNDTDPAWAAGQNIYNKLLFHFANKNLVYLDIRNELNQSINFLGNYDNDIVVTITEADNEAIIKDYYNNFNWPLLRLEALDYDLHANGNDSTGGRLTINIGIPNPGLENTDPIAYIAQGYVRDFDNNRVLRGEQRYVKLADLGGYSEPFKVIVPNINSEPIITPVSQYIKIKYIKSELGGFSSGLVPRATKYLDLVFPIFRMNFPWNIAGNSISRVYNNEDVWFNLDVESGCQFVASIGIAEDTQNVTLFAFAEDKLKTTGATRLQSCSVPSEVSDESYYLNLVRDRFTKDKLVQGILDLGTPPNPLYLRFVDIAPSVPGTLTDGNLRDEFLAIIFPKADFVNMFFDSGFSGQYDIYVRLQNEDVDISIDGKIYTSFDVILEGYNDDGTTVTLGTYDPGLKVYSFGNDRNLIFVEKDSLYDVSTPLDTPPECLGFFNQSELKALQSFRSTLSTAVSPFNDLYSNVFNIPGFPITVSGSGSGPFTLTNPYTSGPTPTVPLPRGFLAEACTIFALNMFADQLAVDTNASNAGSSDSSKSEIFNLLKQVLIDSGFKTPVSNTEKIAFNGMIFPNTYIGQYDPLFRGDPNSIKNRMYVNMASGNTSGSSGTVRFVFPGATPVSNADILKSIDAVLVQLGQAISKYVDAKSKCYYKILSGDTKAPINIFLASGDGSDTNGIFNVANKGALLFNYDYNGLGTVAGTATRTFQSIATENSTVVHLTMFGLNNPTTNSTVTVIKGGIRYLFGANMSSPVIDAIDGTNPGEARYDALNKLFYIDTVSGRLTLAYFNSANRDLIFIERSRNFSFQVQQSSANDAPITDSAYGTYFDEFTTSINVVEGPKVRIFDFEAENLFGNDIFVLSPTQQSNLLAASRYTDPIEFLIDRLINVPTIPITIVLNGNFIGKFLQPNERTTGSKIGKDDTYQFYRTRPQGRILETNTDQTSFTPLRYSFGSVTITEFNIVVSIDSFVSPLWSRLDTKVPAAQKSNLDALTHYYTILGSDAYVDLVGGDPSPSNGTHPNLPSYNPILSGLRSFGLLEALKNIVVARANALVPGTYSSAQVITMKNYLESKRNGAKVLKNDRLGISNDITFTHFTNFQ